ncbi:MAG: hypothetical protein HOK67_18325 [Deltaproteobacteria bacterium]|jgi:hypothetical protein|nr:hypothetical protein [Deltaproteobacteria bacterium]
MALEFMEYEDSPFVFDRETWELFSMSGAHRSKWRKVENSDSCVSIQFQACEISEFEAKSLAESPAREREENGQA